MVKKRRRHTAACKSSLCHEASPFCLLLVYSTTKVCVFQTKRTVDVYPNGPQKCFLTVLAV